MLAAVTAETAGVQPPGTGVLRCMLHPGPPPAAACGHQWCRHLLEWPADSWPQEQVVWQLPVRPQSVAAAYGHCLWSQARSAQECQWALQQVVLRC